MILQLVRKTSIFFIGIGLLALAIVFIFGEQTSSIITTQTGSIGTYTTTFKTIDIPKYLDNLSNAWTNNPLNFEDILPSRTWQNGGNIVNWEPIFNNLALIFDWIYFPLNLLLWVIRWLCWVIRGISAVCGISVYVSPTGVYNSNLISILDFVIDKFMIPYV